VTVSSEVKFFGEVGGNVKWRGTDNVVLTRPDGTTLPSSSTFTVVGQSQGRDDELTMEGRSKRCSNALVDRYADPTAVPQRKGGRRSWGSIFRHQPVATAPPPPPAAMLRVEGSKVAVALPFDEDNAGTYTMRAVLTKPDGTTVTYSSTFTVVGRPRGRDD
jgi:hypothetical protein